MKFIIHTFFILLLLLLTFFGLGPVLYADGVLQERLWTAAVVIVLYAVVAFIYSIAFKWLKNK